MRQNGMIYGTKVIEQIPYRTDRATLRLVDFDAKDQQEIREALLNIQTELMKRAWRLTAIEIQ